MTDDFRRLTQFLSDLEVEKVDHTGKTYMGHLVNVYRLMERHGCTAELCRAGMFHSIYGTQQFQGFKLPLEDRVRIRELIGERAERLAYLNCAMDRPFFDQALEDNVCRYRDRITGAETPLDLADFDDLCRVHLYDWLEQAPRSRYGWGHRRVAYQRMVARLDEQARAAYECVFAQEPAASRSEG